MSDEIAAADVASLDAVIRTPDQVDAEVARQERKQEAAALERLRLAAIIAVSPRCERNEPMVCRDVLAYHEPCSKCGCPSFVGLRPDAVPQTLDDFDDPIEPDEQSS